MEEITEIYFGNGRYLMKNRYYATEHDFGQQRGWQVKLYDAKDSSDEIMEFFSWWYWDEDYGVSDQGENEEFFIINPNSKAVKELLKILDAGTRYPPYSPNYNLSTTLYRQVYDSSNGASFAIKQLENAIKSAQEQRDLLLVSLNNPRSYQRNL